MKPLIIGIAGGTGSGKSSLANKLAKTFKSKEVSIIHFDNYYKSLDNIPVEKRGNYNYDHPKAYDTNLLVSQLSTLKSGRGVHMPEYDFVTHTRTEKYTWLRPTPVIIVEGILILSDLRLVNKFDIKIFVDTDPDVRVLRRIRRDINKRGRSFDSVVSQYLTTVKPMHEKYVEPSKKNADIIIPEGAHNKVALKMLESMIKVELEK